MKLPPSQNIQTASTSRFNEIARILADGFRNDPVLNWLVSDTHYHRGFFAYEIDAVFRQYNFINEEGTGAALWLPPHRKYKARINFNGVYLFGSLAFRHGLAPLKKLYELDKTFIPEHPEEPHFYLHAICSRQDHQGRGIGSALLKSFTRMCDENKTIGYLENSNILNTPLYERHGFEVRKEITLPDGPTVWLMKRPPRDAA